MRSNTIIGCVALFVAWCAAAANAQATFPWVTAPADLARYEHVEECLAMATREFVGAQWSERGRDTLPFNAATPTPPAVVAAARACGARFSPRTVDPADLAFTAQLFVLAGRDVDAEAAIDRDVANQTEPAARAAVLASAVDLYLKARPVRLAAAHARLAQLDALGANAYRARLGAHEAVLEFARAMLDDTLLAREAEAWFGIVRELPDSLRRDSHVVLTAPYVAYDATFPHLADSGAARVAVLLRALAGAALRRPDSTVMTKVGREVPPLAGEFWFNRPDTAQRPRLGRVSVVAYLDDRCSPDYCYPGYAILRRLGRRFGDSVDIVLVSRTLGFYQSVYTPDAKREAELERGMFLDHFRLPGTLVVGVTSITRRPDPDRRVIEQPLANYTGYGQTLDRHLINNYVLVIDGTRRIAFNQPMIPSHERALARAVELSLRMATRVAPGTP